ncbi:hypothetical protein [Halorhabdus salina]|uniref:hypothetical protein n=1 Tax=Halorhabdus salina TaxID=2750670 RepID=UPI00215DC2BF|nr:hypothetical protein [Halorhabdus salina]
MADTTGGVGDKERLLLAAGFAFGVMLTLLVLELILLANGTVEAGDLLTSADALVVIAGVVFTGIVGVALFVLSFPENRSRIPIAADDQE